MKIKIPNIANNDVASLEIEPPLLAELFGHDQFAKYARVLADEHEVDTAPGAELLLSRLAENKTVIREAHRIVSRALENNRQISPAAEWLLDNYYVIEEQILLAEQYLPKRYSRQLPRLKTGKHEGFPRVYDIAFELVSHTDGRIDIGNLSHFIEKYQTVQHLSLGELWAMPIMLRMALIENLRRVAHRIALRRLDRDSAITWAERFLASAGANAKELITVLADFARESPKLSHPFLAELTMRIHGQHLSLGLVINWLERQLAEDGQTIEQILQAESQDQAVHQVSIGNSITSLRALSEIDWKPFVETQSATEKELEKDPSGIYKMMDFRTRDAYRHVVEKLSRYSGKKEEDISAEAVKLAVRRKGRKGVAPREYHVGYFLVDKGLAELERIILPRYPFRDAARRLFGRNPFLIYQGLVTAASLVLAGVTAAGVISHTMYGRLPLTVIACLIVVLASRSAITIINWVITLFVTPQALPRMDFSKGIPDNCRTLVAVQTMLTGTSSIDDLLSGLEIYHVANRDPNVVFTLVADFADADREMTDNDGPLLDYVKNGIEALNKKYAAEDNRIFFLLHRKREWNPSERKWMGYERKRGKVNDLNAFLRGKPGRIIAASGEHRKLLQTVRYVITLDSDTQLPPSTAWKLAGTMAHPLNTPLIDEKTGCVVQGYGIMQPRISMSLVGSSASPFSKLFSGDVGIDPYTHEISDVYHDMIGTTPFLGKGIYDVDAFSAAAGSRFPENTILSHDLIEGLHARCGYINNVDLIEDHPAQYLVDVSRRSRWIRGDWQIMRWLFPRVPDASGKKTRNVLSTTARWMIFDNLRRSIIPPAFFLLLLITGTLFTAGFFCKAAVILSLFYLPVFLQTLWGMCNKPARVAWHYHFGHVLSQRLQQSVRDTLMVVFLPFEAFIGIDAILKAWWRKTISHRNMLEWQTARSAAHGAKTGLSSVLKRMWVNPVTGIVCLVFVYCREEISFSATAAAGLIWILAPFIAWFISRPVKNIHVRFTAEQQAFLRNISRRTWRYFETFAGPEHNWLPPDNVQEKPEFQIAARTSPTNIGLYLLSILAARDFGYISTTSALHRIRNAFSSMGHMERFRGHFLNWYETKSLQTLRPRYVSTVDSGNLVGSLIALRGGLLEMKAEPLLSEQWLPGLRDTARALLDEMRRIARDMPVINAEQLRACEAFAGDIAAYSGPAGTVEDLYRFLSGVIAERAAVRIDLIASADVRSWIAAVQTQCEDIIGEIVRLAPWLSGNCFSGTALERAGSMLDPGELNDLLTDVHRSDTLVRLAALSMKWSARFDSWIEDVSGGDGSPEQVSEMRAWIQDVRRHIADASMYAGNRISELEQLAEACSEFSDWDIEFLFQQDKKLFTIGYNIENRKADNSYYDLFASEARLGSYIGVAQGRIPQEHWFLLGRQQAKVETGPPTLLSWSGSMFEYLMPNLILPVYEGTLTDYSCRNAVQQQIIYGNGRTVPWGISESSYNLIDVHKTYQYRAFGVPALGLMRGLAEDLVVAPYASIMGLTSMASEACLNLQRLAADGMLGGMGMYEAVDYTAMRVPSGQDRVIVQSYMAHHSGMGLLALASVLLNSPMQRRFISDPEMRSALLLLQERIPPVLDDASIIAHPQAGVSNKTEAQIRESITRVYANVNADVPRVQLLSNGRYNVMITNAGGGYSRWHGIDLIRWREDVTRDNYGLYCYIQDVETGAFWSAAYQPACVRPERYEAIFSQALGEFRCVHNDIEIYTKISVSPEDDVEIRRMTVSNLSSEERTLDLTSYAEVVLAESLAEISHPVFNSLFIQTELIPDKSAIICTRRRRSDEEAVPWMFTSMVVNNGQPVRGCSFETDRNRFVGRTRGTMHPAAMDSVGRLSNTSGMVLDPIASIRRRIVIPAGESLMVDLIMGASSSREQVLLLIDKYRDYRLAERVFDIAWTHSQVLLQHLRSTEADAQLFGRLASSIIYPNARHRAGTTVITQNSKNQSSLWRYGISGDLPIMLIQTTDAAGLELVRQAVRCYAYCRNKGLRMELVIWVDTVSGYRQPLRDEIAGMIATDSESQLLDQPGGIFIRTTDQVPEDDRLLIQAAARVYMTDRAGTFAEQVERRSRGEMKLPRFVPKRAAPAAEDDIPVARPDLVFFNGYGGFTRDGREYVIILKPGAATPAPWVNILANERFGSVTGESGPVYTWYENARQFRITPWHNDPVGGTSGEAFYIRDEQTGVFWSPTPGPARGPTTYVCRHGLGYSAYEHRQNDIFSETMIYVPVDAPMKLTLIRVRNLSERERKLSVTSFAECAVGELQGRSSMHVVSKIDPQTNAVFLTNAFNTEFSSTVVFVQTGESERTFTGDRTEFIGRNGSLERPAAMFRQGLSNKVGPALDPCAALQTYITIPAGQERYVVFMMGGAESRDEARNIIRKHSSKAGAWQSLEKVWDFWKHCTGAINIETPDTAMNLLVNNWLLYQVIACRMWGRSGFYQSGGAFGFRDQLQDSMALLHCRPDMMRRHIILCSGRQFIEGDVQHWWHQPSGRGIRTRFSDDCLWLPYTVSRYVQSTGDTGLLDELAPFLSGRPVPENEESYYDIPRTEDAQAPVYEHCVRALELVMSRMGEHGLPLMGCGDWNDGMNKVGIKGKGESVWLAFFLVEVLQQFEGIAAARKDAYFSAKCLNMQTYLKKNIEENTWDGSWYMRAYFDNGTPLGSRMNIECSIDSIPQSWAVLSGAADPERCLRAMDEVEKHLVRPERGIIQLFDPPFDKSEISPGYIKGYIPGVRENGGQYTHAAVWVGMAYAKQHDVKRAWDVARMINPISHGGTRERIQIYMTEPYVVSADIYSSKQHEGRGGWTWYTGSAGWMYRFYVESLLGLKLEVDRLSFAPVLPPEWNEFTVHYRYRETVYHIKIRISGSETWTVRKIMVDNRAQDDLCIHLVDDRIDHTAEVEVG
ncbi:MAG: cyclic beta 1-2 glucan synthetase [Spirochaetes bacterium]|nr:cyclic beta 1-2 glucan synthetase [Spirochaetota bacterium]